MLRVCTAGGFVVKQATGRDVEPVKHLFVVTPKRPFAGYVRLMDQQCRQADTEVWYVVRLIHGDLFSYKGHTPWCIPGDIGTRFGRAYLATTITALRPSAARVGRDGGHAPTSPVWWLWGAAQTARESSRWR